MCAFSPADPDRAALLAENDPLKSQLREAEEIIRAIRECEIDAVVVGQTGPERVVVFEGADQPYRVLVETMQAGAVTLAADGTVLYANPGFARMVACPAHEIINTSFHRYVESEDTSRSVAFLQQRGSGQDELRMVAADGSILPVYLSRSAAEPFGESITVMLVTDLSDQKRQEEILASERLARSILDQAGSPIIVCDERGQITHLSDEAEKLCMCNPLWRQFEDVFALAPVRGGEDPRAFTLQVSLGKLQTVREEVTFTRPDGRVAHLLLSSSPLRGEADQKLGTVLNLTDITHHKYVIEALSESECRLRVLNETLEERVLERSRQVKALAVALTMAEQAERVRIATVLHDHLQQMLFALQLKMELTQSRIRRDTGIVPDELFAEMKALANEALECTRTLTAELSPPALRGDDLAEVLAWLASHMEERYGIRVALVIDRPGLVVSENLRVLLFQMVRELLFNVAKHARVHNARIEVELRGEAVAIRVEDTGVGFDSTMLGGGQSAVGGFGLNHIGERLEVLGGELEIESKPGRGTRATIIVPLQVESARREYTFPAAGTARVQAT
jgi:PAS domain S-box-containing protein